MRKPKTRNNGSMTEAAFFGWLRSLLRNRYMRGWKPHNEVAKDNRRAITYKSRSKWEYQCADCGDWFLRKEIDIDHINPCGTLKSFEDLSDTDVITTEIDLYCASSITEIKSENLAGTNL